MNNFEKWKSELNTDDFYDIMSIEATPCRECPVNVNDDYAMFGSGCRNCFEAWATAEVEDE